MNISQKEIQNIAQVMNINFREINHRLTKYNERIDKIIKETNYPSGITYDQLSDNIIQISGDSYNREIKIEKL